MKKINLKNYTAEAPLPDGTLQKVPYDVRVSIENVMLAAGEMTKQRLSKAELRRNARVADKIILCKDDFILLEEEEYKCMLESFDAFRGYGKNEVELCRRIDEAETVEVEEKKQK